MVNNPFVWNISVIIFPYVHKQPAAMFLPTYYKISKSYRVTRDQNNAKQSHQQAVDNKLMQQTYDQKNKW